MPGWLSKLASVIMFSRNPDSSVQDMGRGTIANDNSWMKVVVVNYEQQYDHLM